MKQAQVFKRKRELFILPSSQTTEGVWMGTDPVVKLDDSASHEEQGEAVVRALSASQHGVPHPLDWNVPTNSLLCVAGAKSWDEFEKNAKSITVELDHEGLRITPWRNLGPGRGFGPILAPTENIRLPANASAKEIGPALEDALSRCQ